MAWGRGVGEGPGARGVDGYAVREGCRGGFASAGSRKGVGEGLRARGADCDAAGVVLGRVCERRVRTACRKGVGEGSGPRVADRALGGSASKGYGQRCCDRIKGAGACERNFVWKGCF